MNNSKCKPYPSSPGDGKNPEKTFYRKIKIENSERTKENIVSSFFYYMWCRWSKEECDTVFPGPISDHLWDKWRGFTNQSLHGAAERYFAELSNDNRRLLVQRACQLYDGNHYLPGHSSDNNSSPQDYAEALVDIAYEAGTRNFRPTGNSRDIVDTMINWANEFTCKHKNTDWNETEYLDTIYEFTDKKISEYQVTKE